MTENAVALWRKSELIGEVAPFNEYITTTTTKYLQQMYLLLLDLYVCAWDNIPRVHVINVTGKKLQCKTTTTTTKLPLKSTIFRK